MTEPNQVSIREFFESRFTAHRREHEKDQDAIELARSNLDLRLEKLNELRSLVSELQTGYVPLGQFTQINDRLWERLAELERWQASAAPNEPNIRAHSDRINLLERNTVSRDFYDQVLTQWQEWRSSIDVALQQMVDRKVFEKSLALLEEKISSLLLADREWMSRAEFEAFNNRAQDERAANRRSMNTSLFVAVVALAGAVANAIWI